MRRSVVTAWVATAIGLAFFALFLHDANWGEIGAVLVGADLRFIVLGVALSLSMYLFRAVRWSALLAPVASLPLRRTLVHTCVGYGANVLLPARAGEVVRCAMVHREAGARLSAVLATVVLERLADLFVLLSLMVLVLVFVQPAGIEALGIAQDLRSVGTVFVVATLSVLVGLAVLCRWPDRARRAVGVVTWPLPAFLASAIDGLVVSFTAGLAVMRGGLRPWLGIAAASVGVWSFSVAFYWCTARALGLHLGAVGAGLAQVCTAFAVALPQAPGYLGAFQVACEAAMRILGVPTSPAKGYAILVWFLGAVPIALVALGLVWREGVSLGRLRDEGAAGDGGEEVAA